MKAVKFDGDDRRDETKTSNGDRRKSVIKIDNTISLTTIISIVGAIIAVVAAYYDLSTKNQVLSEQYKQVIESMATQNSIMHNQVSEIKNDMTDIQRDVKDILKYQRDRRR